MKKSATTTPENEVRMAKSPQNAKVNDDDTKLDRTLQLATTSVIVNKRITTPVHSKLGPPMVVLISTSPELIATSSYP